MDMECIWSHMFYWLRCSLAFYDAAIGYFFHISLMVVVGNRWNNALRIFEIVVHTHSPLSIVNKKCVAAKLRFTSTLHFTTQQSPPWHERHQQNIFASMSKAWGNEDFNKKKTTSESPSVATFHHVRIILDILVCLSVWRVWDRRTNGLTEYKCEKRSVKWKQQTKKLKYNTHIYHVPTVKNKIKFKLCVCGV